MLVKSRTGSNLNQRSVHFLTYIAGNKTSNSFIYTFIYNLLIGQHQLQAVIDLWPIRRVHLAFPLVHVHFDKVDSIIHGYPIILAATQGCWPEKMKVICVSSFDVQCSILPNASCVEHHPPCGLSPAIITGDSMPCGLCACSDIRVPTWISFAAAVLVPSIDHINDSKGQSESPAAMKGQ